MSILLYFVYRHLRLESQLVDYWWKIKYEEIDILQTRRRDGADGTNVGDDKSSVISSLNLSSKAHSEHGAKTTVTNVSSTLCVTYGDILLANYKLGRVSLKPISKFHQSRKLMLELRIVSITMS